jgi:hypothetical protein
VTWNYAEDFKDAGGKIYLNHALKTIEESEDPDYPIRIVSSPEKVSLFSPILTDF